MLPIPVTLAPFFQEYDLAQLNPQRNADTVIERILQFGNRAEIAAWFQKYAKERLPEPHNTFWRIILEINV